MRAVYALRRAMSAVLRGRLLVAQNHEHLRGAIDDGHEVLKLSTCTRPGRFGNRLRHAEREVALHDERLAPARGRCDDGHGDGQ